MIVIENPVGYLFHHPVSKLFASVLELEMIEIHYCSFSTADEINPQKPTHLWTNSRTLIGWYGSKFI